ncbi:hypothetical protein MNV49_001167 [Pseudohyphozyma bogoriensis]|nr:hypothetical protein MNV49_001167 [Pseudohyphozyma bogoriensis]
MSSSTTASPPSIPHLPPELIGLIIAHSLTPSFPVSSWSHSYFLDRSLLLLSYARVSRVFRHFAQSHLFRFPVVQLKRIHRLAKVVREVPELAAEVRSVGMKSLSLRRPSLSLRQLEEAKVLECLTIAHGSFRVVNPGEEEPVSPLRTLRELSMTGVSLPANLLTPEHFPELRHLGLRYTTQSDYSLIIDQLTTVTIYVGDSSLIESLFSLPPSLLSSLPAKLLWDIESNDLHLLQTSHLAPSWTIQSIRYHPFQSGRGIITLANELNAYDWGMPRPSRARVHDKRDEQQQQDDDDSGELSGMPTELVHSWLEGVSCGAETEEGDIQVAPLSPPPPPPADPSSFPLDPLLFMPETIPPAAYAVPSPSRSTTSPPPSPPPLPPRSTLWASVLSRTPLPTTTFVYCVPSTRIYCRPTCPSRRPIDPSTISYYPSPTLAALAGFRACKRCNPDDSQDPTEKRRNALVERAKEVMETRGGKVGLKELSRQVGCSEWHLLRVFKRAEGVTPEGWSRRVKERCEGAGGRTKARKGNKDSGEEMVGVAMEMVECVLEELVVLPS